MSKNLILFTSVSPVKCLVGAQQIFVVEYLLDALGLSSKISSVSTSLSILITKIFCNTTFADAEKWVVFILWSDQFDHGHSLKEAFLFGTGIEERELGEGWA